MSSNRVVLNLSNDGDDGEAAKAAMEAQALRAQLDNFVDEAAREGLSVASTVKWVLSLFS